jgi:hypothetical protein
LEGAIATLLVDLLDTLKEYQREHDERSDVCVCELCTRVDDILSRLQNGIIAFLEELQSKR